MMKRTSATLLFGIALTRLPGQAEWKSYLEWSGSRK